MAASHCSRTGFFGKPDPSPIFTIGHSIHELADFLKLLKSAAPRVSLVDVRSHPRARRAWFNKDRLSAALASVGHEYAHLPLLGGRQSVPFVEYTQTGKFRRGVAQVLDFEKRSLPIVLMCSESDPSECHRRFIASALTARGRTVTHILRTGKLLSQLEMEF